jgi:hypothetical protein
MSDSRCLRPAIRPIRREGHDPMLIQKLKELRFQTVVRKRLGDPRSPIGQAGGAVALGDDLAIATVQQSLPPPVGTEAPGRCDIQAPSTCGGVHRDGRGEPDSGDRRVH